MIAKVLKYAGGWKGYVLTAAAAALVGWTVNGWRLNGELSRLESEYAQEFAAAAAAAQKRQAALVAERDAEAARHAAVESELYGKLRNAETENERLRADVDAGHRRLRVRAICPAARSPVPKDGTASSMDHGTGAELDPAARSDYFALRAGIERVTKQLAACQARFK